MLNIFLKRYPITSVFIAINIGVFVLLHGIHLLAHIPLEPLAYQYANFAPLSLTTDYWRLLSSVFMHIDSMHLISNLAGLMIFGALVERTLSRSIYVFTYMCSGFFASLCSALPNLLASIHGLQESTRPFPSIHFSLGASGAIMALAGVMAVLNFQTKNTPVSATRQQQQGFMMAAVLTIILGLVMTGFDTAAHAGGAVFGVLFALLYRVCAPFKALKHIPVLALAAVTLGLFLIMQHSATPLLPFVAQIKAAMNAP